MKFDRSKNRYLSQDGFDYLSGDVEKQDNQEPIYKVYEPDKFHSSGVSDFDLPKEKAPF